MSEETNPQAEEIEVEAAVNTIMSRDTLSSAGVEVLRRRISWALMGHSQTAEIALWAAGEALSVQFTTRFGGRNYHWGWPLEAGRRVIELLPGDDDLPGVELRVIINALQSGDAFASCHLQVKLVMAQRVRTLFADTLTVTLPEPDELALLEEVEIEDGDDLAEFMKLHDDAETGRTLPTADDVPSRAPFGRRSTPPTRS